jgi:heme exporter protein D
MDSTRQAPVDILATTTTEENESTNKPMKRTFEHVGKSIVSLCIHVLMSVDDEDELLNHLSKQQQRKLRKLRRAQKRGEAGLNTPEFVLKLEVEKNGISIKDVRNLILWCIGEGVNPRWMLIKNKLYLYRVVVLLIPFLDASIFDGSNMNAIPMEQVVQEANTRPERNVNLPKGMFAYLPRISTHFKHVCPTRGPSENYRLVNPFTALIQCPLTKSELKLQEKALREQSK